MNKHMGASNFLHEWLTASGTSQSELAEIIGVSRAAVSKWVNNTMSPSEQHAEQINELSQGAVPATLWPRRRPPAAASKGAAAIQKAAQRYNGSISQLAREKGLPQRALARWAANQNGPRARSLAELNAALKTNLKPGDFQVQA